MVSLAELRAQIDNVDQRIIALLAERAGYVQQIAAVKKSEHNIVAPAREQHVYETRRLWATDADLDPDFVEKLYREIIAYFTEKQREQLRVKSEK